jgi:diacylglycerol kinase family enzyme
VARNLTYLQPTAYHIRIDGHIRSIRAVEIIISNTGIVGTPRFHLWDTSVIDDGLLEVLAIRQWSPGTALDALLDVSTQGKKRAIALIGRGKEVHISSLKPVPVLADGDPLDQHPVKVSVIPKAINLIVP